MAEINLALPDDKIKPKSMEIVMEKRAFMGWQPVPDTFIKLEYENNTNRQKAIEKLHQSGWKTFHNEKSNYFRTVSRDTGKTISSWVSISNYTVEDHPDYGRIFKVAMENYSPIKEFKKNPALARDKQMVLAWDIEVADRTGDFPVPENKDSKLFMIAGSCHWHSQKTPLVQVCFVDHPTAPSRTETTETKGSDELRPNYITVICGTEANVILGFAYLFNRMQPDYCIGFNVADFDWRWFCVSAFQYCILYATA
jgi:DNA polymerase elongation subunit (family B)